MEFVYSYELEAWNFGILIMELYQPEDLGPNIYNYITAVMEALDIVLTWEESLLFPHTGR